MQRACFWRCRRSRGPLKEARGKPNTEGSEEVPLEQGVLSVPSLPHRGRSVSTCTFVGVNASDEAGHLSPTSGGRAAAAEPPAFKLDGGTGVSPAEPEEEVAPLMARIEHLVDVEYDILKAERLLAELQRSCMASGAGWDSVVQHPVFSRFRRRMDCFLEVGAACCGEAAGWFQAYEDATKTRSIHGFIDPADGRQLLYRVRVQIPTSLANVIAVANEVQLLPQWNGLVVNDPEVIGRRTAHYMVLNYQMSMLGGMQKVDIFNEVRRFSDAEGGFLAEYIETVPEDHPSYRAPRSGFKRPTTLMKNLWVACGPNQTVLIQVGRLSLPVAISRWFAMKIGAVAGKYIIEGLVKNSLRAAEPGSPWQELLQVDRFGLYERMGECMASCESSRRSPPPAARPSAGAAPVADFDLGPWFRGRPVLRMGWP